MKARTAIGWNVLVALALLLAAGAAHAQTVVFDPGNLTKATGILNLDVPGFGTYDVVFEEQATAKEIYGPFPGDLVGLAPFFTIVDVSTAASVVSAALNGAPTPVFSIGEADGGPGIEGYNIGVAAFLCCLTGRLDILPEDIPSLSVGRVFVEGEDWGPAEENFLTWAADSKSWAVFTLSGAEAMCGNGDIEVGEQCDDGNTMSGDGCSGTCTLEQSVCGNGAVEVGEQCDDFNTMSGDGCSDICMLETQPVCGNGALEVGEQCDDGNTMSGDGCSTTCLVEASGEAQVIFDPENETKATGILNLDVPGFGTFNVVFEEQATANEIYGPFPGDEVGLAPFFTAVDVSTAASAVNAELNFAPTPVFSIGEADGGLGIDGYNIGVAAFLCCGTGRLDILPEDIQSLSVGRTFLEDGDEWGPSEENFLTWDADSKSFAVFTLVPEPSMSLLSVAALATLGVVRRWRRKEREGTALA
jgi:cysteine-rich repeat protein